jgi:hypothetical protein
MDATKINKKRTCGYYKCKKVVHNKINILCKFHDWEKKITTVCLWDSFRESNLFHSIESGKMEKEVHETFKRRFSSESCFKFKIKEDIKNEKCC